MDIQNKSEVDKGKFIIEEHGEILAEMDYMLKGKNILLITHTEVDESLSGQGIGRKLVAAAADHARQNSLRIKSVCSFAKAILDKSPEYADIYTS